MGRNKLTGPQIMEPLNELCRTYELGTYGTIYPQDVKLPLTALSATCREISGHQEGPGGKKDFGRMLLQLLIAAKRSGLELNDVMNQAAQEAADVSTDAAAALARLEDDGSPIVSADE